MKCNLLRIYTALLICASSYIFSGCSPDNDGNLGTMPTASFTMSPVDGVANTYALHATSENAFGYMWNKGTGEWVRGEAEDTAYFATAGDFVVSLRAYGRGGYASDSQKVKIEQDDVMNNPIFQKLSAHPWKLDPTGGANAITVGTESNPAEYFGGGALDNCQKDDVYTFNTNLTLTYQANGATFNGGNIAPNFTCGTGRSYANIAISFAPSVTAGEGIATISILANVPDRFIGVTDISSNNYRIISISDTEMVLRSGTAAETVHQFKFVAQ